MLIEVALDNNRVLKAARFEGARAWSLLGDCLGIALVHVVAVLVAVVAHQLSFLRLYYSAFH